MVLRYSGIQIPTVSTLDRASDSKSTQCFPANVIKSKYKFKFKIKFKRKKLTLSLEIWIADTHELKASNTEFVANVCQDINNSESIESDLDIVIVVSKFK